MTTPSLPPEGRGIDPNLSTCRESQCNNHGNCVTLMGGGTDLVCNCDLGYKGDSCEDTINGALSVPLTLSVFAVLIGLVILAFVAAKFRQKQKKKRRKLLEEKVYSNTA
ncbi:ephrin-B [Sarotherodon galilaeus]